MMEHIGFPVKVDVSVRKFANEDDHQNGIVQDVVDIKGVWIDADGSVIEDEDRIAELEAKHQTKE